ncbi:MAG: hypothetical protein M1828_007301 [Chrysothrix sp. TS-e1954]|nr:MAG: hypothetical protein M1828_007301 [Chrysothrix sp. TS-e1954]
MLHAPCRLPRAPPKVIRTRTPTTLAVRSTSSTASTQPKRTPPKRVPKTKAAPRPTPALSTPNAQSSLEALKLKDLRHIAQECGIQSSETKALLCSRLRKELLQPRLGDVSTSPLVTTPISGSSSIDSKSNINSNAEHNGDYRILSIDMGIRNLAFALLSVSLPPSASASTSASPPINPIPPIPTSGTTPPPSTTHTTLTHWHRLTLTPPSFTPSHLAPLAHHLTVTHLLPLNPTHILIERQRHRSGGGASVLEWTVRVNAFEACLWGVLSALKHDGIRIEGVSPRAVSGLWVSEMATQETSGGEMEGGEGRKDKKGKGKAEKEAKISIASDWLTGPTKPLLCTDQAAAMSDTFLALRGPKRGPRSAKGGMRRRRGSAGSSVRDGSVEVGRDGSAETSHEGSTEVSPDIDVNSNPPSPLIAEAVAVAEAVAEAPPQPQPQQPHKLDDLADCLLQGMAWVEWEMNRRRVVREYGLNSIELS